MRVLAQYVRLDGEIHRLAVIDIPADGSRPVIVPADGETHSTIFFNGLIFLAEPYLQIPASIRASEVSSLLASFPEPLSAAPFQIAKIAFKP